MVARDVPPGHRADDVYLPTTIARVVAIDVATPRGLARARILPAEAPIGGLVLGHGAGGGVDAPDLAAAAGAAVEAGFSVALVEQPYRVVGRRSPPPGGHLDEAWTAVLARLAGDQLSGLPLVVGGRSSGARVACRTAAACAARGVLCLAFPLQPPRREERPPAPSRLGELDAVPVPTLVVQGASDPFGMPPGGVHRTVVVVAGDHSLRGASSAVAAAVLAWLPSLVPSRQ